MHRGVGLLVQEGMWSNPKRPTMIVEGQGMGFWTRVRLPSGPVTTTLKRREISVLLGVFFQSDYCRDILDIIR